MTGQYIQRVPNRRRRGCVFTGLVVVIIFAVLAVVLLPHLPEIALRLAGFRELGDSSLLVSDAGRLFGTPSTSLVTASIGPTGESPAPDASESPNIGSTGAEAAPSPEIAVVEAIDSSPQTLSVDIPNVGIIPLEGAQRMLVNGVESTVVTMGEVQLNALCRARVALCGDTPTPPVYGATVDLKTGGAMIYGIINFPQFGIYQSVGVAVRVDGAEADVLAIDYNGRLYAVPEGGIGDAIANIEQRAHDALTQVVGAIGDESVRFVGAFLTDDDVTLVFR